MCGIAGVINLKDKSKVGIDYINKVISLLSHRGPDDNGYFQDNNLTFIQTRLSIIDLSRKGHQPMFDKDKRYAIVLNGEIYNYAEIREELIKKGYVFESSTDTEVVLYSLIEYGIDALNKFNGMFVFSFYDIKSKRVIIARDRLGIKPLYYSKFNGKLIFGSEIKVIINYPDYDKSPDYNGISSYLSFRYPISDLTLFKNIKTLEPGFVLDINLGKNNIKKIQYWQLPPIFYNEDRGEEYYIDNIRKLLLKSVKYRMISDVPLGAYLSGGLDSSIIVAAMSLNNARNIKTFTIGFKEKEFNEFEYSELVAKMYDSEHRSILLTTDGYFKNMVDLIKYKDLPLGVQNEPALYVMSKELKKYITVVLSGEGADELFGGYGRIFISPYDYLRLKKADKNLFYKILFKNVVNKYNGEKDFVSFFLNQYKYINNSDKRIFFNNDFINMIKNDEYIDNIFDENFKKIDSFNIYDRFLWIFEKLHIVGLLLRLDITTMATSVEGRVPFLDHNLIEFVFKMPFKYKIRWKSFYHKIIGSFHTNDKISENYNITKYILRKSFENNLPKEVISRKKVGFPVPLDHWFKGRFNDIARSYLFSDKAKQRGIYNIKNIDNILSNSEKLKDMGLKLWMILNLEIWFREYFN